MQRDAAPVRGYVMREVEWLMATYGISYKKAIWRFPRLLTHLLMPVFAQRQGATGGLSFAERASIKARQSATAWLELHYNIIDKPLAETGWQLGEPPSWLAGQLNKDHGQ